MLISKESIHNFVNMVIGLRKPVTILQLSIVILFHIICWLVFFSLPFLFYRLEVTDGYFLNKELINKGFLLLLFYGNYFFFLPRLLEKKRFILFFIAIGLSITLLFIQQLLLERSILAQNHYSVRMVLPPQSSAPVTKPIHVLPAPRDARFPLPDDQLMVDPFLFSRPVTLFWGLPTGIIGIILGNVLTSSLLLILIGSFIRLTSSMMRHLQEKKVLENASLNAEVNFLKSQINPHFLFNTLNTIYAQAYSQSAQTHDSVLKLSEMLRYVLYSSNEKKIALREDLHYIENYIALQQQRLASNVTIDFSLTGNAENLTIAPLLLITFIENAFKHGISYAHPSTILIRIHLEGNRLTLAVSNSIHYCEEGETGGIGLLNAKRRLDLIYPEAYTLDIQSNPSTYNVHLLILLQ